jgi:hypothetical protein
VYHRRAVSLALVGLLVWVTGCYNYTPIGPSQVGYYGRVRVSTIDGERKVISEPRVEADSLRGKDVRTIALIQVAELEGISLNEAETVMAVGTIVLGAIAVGYFVAHCGEADMFC